MLKEVGLTYYVNLASPYIIDNSRVKYIDYDLDIKLYPNQDIKVIDVREYGYHRKKYGYSESIDKILRYNINDIKKAMQNKEFPFNEEIIKKYYDEFLKLTSKGK